MSESNEAQEAYVKIELYSVIAKFKPSITPNSTEYANRTSDGYYVLKVKQGMNSSYQFWYIDDAKELLESYKEKISEYKIIKQISEVTEMEIEQGFV